MRGPTAIRREIRARWAEICAAAGTRPEACEALPLTPTLLGSGTKTVKGLAKGIITAVVYMAPADEAFSDGDGRTLCPRATEGCALACLGRKAGRMVMKPVKRARLWKTTLYLGARELWRELILAEISAFEAKASREGYRPAVRIDGSTDIGEGAYLANFRPGVAFYDYTKVPCRALRYARGGYAPNYHVTFSYSGANHEECLQVLAAGGNVAAVVSTHPREPALQGTLWGYPTLSGDDHDARFLDPIGGSVVLLSFKAAKNRDAALQAALRDGFVVHADQIASELAA